MENNSTDESWIGDKVLERLADAQQEASNNLAKLVARNDLSPSYPVSSHPRTLSDYELQSLNCSSIDVQSIPSSNLTQGSQALSFSTTKGHVTGPGFSTTQGPGTAPLSSEPTLTTVSRGSNTISKPKSLPVNTVPGTGSPSRPMTFPIAMSQFHHASFVQNGALATSGNALPDFVTAPNSTINLTSSSIGNFGSPSTAALSLQSSDCFYIDTSGSPRLRSSLGLSGRPTVKQHNTPLSSNMQLSHVRAEIKDQSRILHEHRMSSSLKEPIKETQILPIRSASKDFIPYSASAAYTPGRHTKNIPSQPRAMRETKATETKAAMAFEVSEITPKLPKLREVDLAKWPCRTCRFVHRGGECETICIGCASRNPDIHDIQCPYKNKKRPEDRTKSISKQEISLQDSICFNDVHSQSISNSLTTKLSLECQKRGFNPEFRYFGHEKSGECMAELCLKGKIVSEDGRVYRSQKEARDALAEKALNTVLRMDCNDQASRFVGPARKMTYKEESSFEGLDQSVNQDTSLIKRKLDAKVRAWPGSPSRQEQSDFMDIDKADSMTGNFRTDKSSNVRANRKDLTILPTNIRVHEIPRVIGKAISNSGPASISFNLPANVSTEIAEAYGRGFAMIINPSRRIRSRSRSRSPGRDRSRFERDYRERDDFYNHMGRLPMRDEYRPARDIYHGPRDRGLLHDRGRKTAENARFRFSPPGELISRDLIKEEPRSPDAYRLQNYYRK